MKTMYKFTSSILLTTALMLVVFVSNTQAREPHSIALTDSEIGSTALARVNQITARQATTTTAGVWVAHVAPFSNTITGTTVDVRVNGTQVLTGVQYKQTSGSYLNVTPGQTLVEIVAGGTVALSDTFDLITGTNYTLAATGDGMNKTLQLLPVVDDLTQVNDKAKVKIIHTAPFTSGPATVDILLADNTPITTGLSYTQTTGYLALTPTTYALKVVASGTTTPTLIDIPNFPVQAGEVWNVFAVGGANGFPAEALPIKIQQALSPTLQVTPTVINLTATEGMTNPSEMISITNLIPGAIEWLATSSNPWLQVNGQMSVTDTTPSMITATANISGVTANTYTETITITATTPAQSSPQTVTVVLTVQPAAAMTPTLQVDPTMLMFNAMQGGANPAGKIITVTTNMTTTVPWTATSGVPTWLQVNGATSVTDTTSAQITATVNISGVMAGTYTNVITVESSMALSSPQTVTVVLQVQGPSLVVTPPNLAFSAFVGQADPVTPQVLNVTSNMTQSLVWTATTDASWLTLSNLTGTTPSDITATVNISGLTATMYSRVITLESAMAANSPVTVPVTLDLRNPGLQVDPTMLTFNAVLGGPNPAGQAITISNSFTNTLVWTATSNAPTWLHLTSLTQTTPVSTVTGATPATITATVDISGVAVGTYSNTIVVDAGLAQNSPQTVTVYLNITQPVITPVLQVNPLALSFTAVESGTNPAGQIFNITNGVTGTLAWTATSSVPNWLMVNGAATVTGTTPASVTATVNISGVMAGTYSGVITVEGDMAQNSPQIVSVTLTVQPATTVTPTLQVAPTMLMFTATEGMTNPAAQMISVTNAVTGTIDWTATSSAPSWLLVNGQATATGTTPSMIMATVNISGVAANTYTETIVINGAMAANSPQTVTVVLTVQPAATPVLQVMPTGLTFTATEGDTDPAAQTFQVMNTGSGTLTWTVMSDIPWLTLTPISGTAPSTVTASVAISGLTANTYTGIVVINSLEATNTSPQTVAVTLTVQPAGGPVLQVAPVTLDFTATEGGSDPAAQTFQVTNTGTGALDWTATESITWLTLSPMTGTAPTTVTASVSISGLVANTYIGTIEISGTNAANSPQTVTVTLTVEAPTATGFVYLPLIMRQPQPSPTATPTATSPTSPTMTPTPTATSPANQQPDLTSEIILEPANPTAGQNVTVKVIVRNIGTRAVTDGFWVDFYINPKQQPATGGRWNDSALISELADPNGVQGIAWAIAPDDFGGSLDPNESITLVSMPRGQTAAGEIGYTDAQTSWHGRFVSGTSALYSYADSYEVTGNVRGVIEDEILDSFDNNGDVLQAPEFGPLGEPLDIEVTAAEFAPRTNP